MKKNFVTAIIMTVETKKENGAYNSWVVIARSRGIVGELRDFSSPQKKKGRSRCCSADLLKAARRTLWDRFYFPLPGSSIS